MNHEYFMGKALEEARKAYEIREVPIGCVIVYNNEIIASGYNSRNTQKNSLYHAEIIAIDKACKAIGDWRLEDCYLYVTVEPCPMCAGAMVQARVKGLIFGTRNKKAGSCGSIINLANQEGFNHQVEIIEGVLSDECADLMKGFFADLRKAETPSSKLVH